MKDHKTFVCLFFLTFNVNDAKMDETEKEGKRKKYLTNIGHSPRWKKRNNREKEKTSL